MDQEVNAETRFEALAAERKDDLEVYRTQRTNDLNEKARALLAVLELEGQVTSLKADLESMKEEKCRWQREAHGLGVKLESEKRNGLENATLRELFRAHLDDSADDMENDNEWEQEGRQVMWDEGDAEELQRLEEIDK